MHNEVKSWFGWVLNRFSDYKTKPMHILDFGSLDINGNNKQFFPIRKSYTGIDICEGKNVDVVSLAHKYKHEFEADVVVSTEMLEHDINAKSSFKNMVVNLRSGGLLIMTCAGYGRPEHGTHLNTPEDSPATNDFYENITLSIFSKWLDFDSIFSHYEINKDGNDLRFFGIKR